MMSRHVSTNKPLHEAVPRNKIWAKPTDQMDLWLDSQGYYRKHTAKDGSCLYRAISEQIFLAQAFHLNVRKQCADYARRHPELLNSITHCSLNDYIEQMKHPHEAGGNLEIQLMSQMYRKDFFVFNEVGKNFLSVTNHGYDEKVMLCLSQERHYDSVYTKQFISNAAFCQSIVYEVLYKGVFELQEVDYAVKKMLHDKTTKYQRDPSSFIMNGLALRLEIRDSYANVKDLLTLGVTPFPYKVAKSLDPDIYRNVEFDTWNDIRRGMRYGMYSWNNRELQVGAKCLVKLQPDQVCHAHIQEMAPNKGPVLVFVEEFGEKMTVTYDCLELLPLPPQPQTLPLPLKQLKSLQSIKELSSMSQEDEHTISDVNEKEKIGHLQVNQRNQEKESIWREDIEIDGRTTPKLKMFSELSRQSKKSTKAYRTKTKDLHHINNDAAKNRIETNSVVSSSDCNYQQQDTMSFQHEGFDDYNSHGYIHQEANGASREEPKAAEVTPPTTTMLCIEPQHYYADSYPHPTYCYVPHKSVLPDGSDLPLADMTTLRFYYNYGIDHYARGVRPTPPCYLNTAVAYVPDTTISPAPGYDCNSSITSPDSAVVMSPVGVYSQRPNSLPVAPSPVINEPDSTTYNSQNVAPRFKNKLKTMQGRSYEPPVQQPEISSTTTNIPVATHYIPPPLYYHPVECDAFCPSNFVEYSVYDPTIFYPSPHPPPPPTHYIHPDALFYQHVVAAPIPSAL